MCAVFVTPAAVGFMADKLGNFTRVLILTLIGSAAFHSVLLFIPVVTRTQQAALEEASFLLMPDQGANMEGNVCLINQLRSAPATSFPVNVTLAECQLDCTLKLSDICSHIKSSTCHHINESQIGNRYSYLEYFYRVGYCLYIFTLQESNGFLKLEMNILAWMTDIIYAALIFFQNGLT